MAKQHLRLLARLLLLDVVLGRNVLDGAIDRAVLLEQLPQPSSSLVQREDLVPAQVDKHDLLGYTPRDDLRADLDPVHRISLSHCTSLVSFGKTWPMHPRQLLVDGRLRPLTAVSHKALVAAELATVRVLDRVTSTRPDVSDLAAVTALVKTFERPGILRRLIESIRRVYPDLRVLVVDDSRKPTELSGIETVTLPYDSGIGAGRNEALRHATTRYVLVLDDDFVFHRGTRLGPALRIMESHPEIDIMGGQLLDLPLLRKRPPPRGEIFHTGAQPRHPLGSTIDGLEVVDKVSQFFLARRDRLELVRWDGGLKRADHADFFSRALGVLTTVFNPDLRCMHARTPFDDAYMEKRMDLDESLQRLHGRYGG